jgi:hypothetical protein
MVTQTALSIGGTIGFALSNASTPLLTLNASMKKIVFHNADAAVIIYVCQSLDITGAAQTAGPNPGNFAIYPGGFLTLEGDGIASGSWLGAAASAGAHPLTVALSQTL